MTQKMSLSKKISSSLLDNVVTIVFIAFAVIGYIYSGDFTPSSFMNEIAVRFFRNALLILALIIPVIAGLGLNFGIVVGALVGMLSIIIVRYNMISGSSLRSAGGCARNANHGECICNAKYKRP